MNTADHCEAIAARHPERGALVDGGSAMTWAEVSHRAGRLAGALVARGLPRGARIYLQAPNAIEVFLTRLACERAGLRAVTVPAPFRRAEIDAIVRATRPMLAIVPGQYHGVDFPALLASIPEAPRDVVTLTRWPAPGVPTLESLATGAGDSGAGSRAARQLAEHESSQLGTTSGSTGTPKLVEVTIGARLRTGRVQAQRYGVTSDDVVLALTPLITGTADALGYHGAPQVGFRLVLSERFDEAEACEAIVAHRATVVIGVPTMATRLLASEHLARVPRGQVRLFLSHAAILAPSVARRLEAALGCRVMQAFGTFDYGGVCATRADDGEDVRLATVGRPLDGNELVVLDEHGHRRPPGTAGRLYVRGAHANAGYYRDPEATRAAWVNGYYDLMEIGRADSAGNVSLLGRARDIIIRGGQNIFPHEIEELLARHPEVAEAAVVALPDPTLGETACACIVRAPGARVSGAELLDFLRRLDIAAFKLPERFEFFDTLPMLATGHKVDKRRLRNSVVKGVA